VADAVAAELERWPASVAPGRPVAGGCGGAGAIDAGRAAAVAAAVGAAAAAAAELAGVAADAPAPGNVGSLMVAVGFGGKLMRTVSFLT
jgi:hypothetical protein